MPFRLTLESVATPFEFVDVLPTPVPLSVNATGSFATGVPLFVSVAERLVLPPNVPVAGPTASVVAVADKLSLKQTLTLESDGVTELLLVARKASYLR
jgi:hypothetical protein